MTSAPFPDPTTDRRHPPVSGSHPLPGKRDVVTHLKDAAFHLGNAEQALERIERQIAGRLRADLQQMGGQLRRVRRKLTEASEHVGAHGVPPAGPRRRRPDRSEPVRNSTDADESGRS